jgi:hypothetical protein
MVPRGTTCTVCAVCHSLFTGYYWGTARVQCTSLEHVHLSPALFSIGDKARNGLIKVLYAYVLAAVQPSSVSCSVY